ncbi:DUF6986 family protein [Dermacoccaceae bacterium W4C1]
MTDIGDRLVGALDQRLREIDAARGRRYPGDATERQPVHTVYVPADRFEADTIATWGATALDLMDRFAPDPATLATAVGAQVSEVEAVWPALRAKLSTEPIEDLRVDFEDGYGRRSDETEDADLARAAQVLSDPAGRPRWFGIRFKCFEPPVHERGLRTLASFVAAMSQAERTGQPERAGQVPHGLTLTLPKVTSLEQVAAMADACDLLEAELSLAPSSLGFEVQVETAQAVLSADGTATVAPMIDAGRGRVTSLHYGTFDYSAGLGVAAAHQSLDHPVADHAKDVMQVAIAQTGVRMSDGSTNVIAFEDAEQAAATWRLHAGLVNRSLTRGIYQGWDMHPGHLVSRYLATYLFFRRAAPAANARLGNYLARQEGAVMDEPATARMLAHVLLRGIRCGAVDPEEVQRGCGLTEIDLAALTR